MKPENQAFLVVLVAFALVVAVGGVYFLAVPSVTTPAPPVPFNSLPIPVGTIIPGNSTYSWVAYFSVPFEGGRLVGAWTSYTSWEGSLVVANGTLAYPPRYPCPLIVGVPHEVNGTFDVPLGPGAYTIYVESCSVVSKIVITETIQVVDNSFLG